MSLRKKVRPSSASGKLETFNLSSILTKIQGPPTAGGPARWHTQTSQGGLRLQAAPPVCVDDFTEAAWEDDSPLPEWLAKEMLKRQQRSYSIGLMENISESTNAQRHFNPAKSLWKGKIEQQMTLEQLKRLNSAFQELEKDGYKSLDVEKFKQIMKKCVSPHSTNDEQVEKLFMKIDYAATGSIQWDDFCTYMQLEYAEQDRSSAQLKQAAFSLPAARQQLSHGEPVLRICSLADHTLVTAQEDGVVSFWSSQLKLKRSKMIFEKTAKKKPKWVLDFTVMTQYNKLLLGTADHEIQLYELSNFEPYCQISALEAVPLRLDYCYTDHDECMVLYGDDQGCVNILLMSSVGELLRELKDWTLKQYTSHRISNPYDFDCFMEAFSETISAWKKRMINVSEKMWKKLPKAENLPSICLESAILSPSVTYIRWKVHEDWVTQLNYYDSIKAVISTSSHELTALVIGCTVGATNVEQQMKEIQEPGKGSKGRKGQLAMGSPPRRAKGDQTVFRVHKGVKTFAFSKRNNLLVTGGMDRTIRLWNPYVPSQCAGMLRSHTAPIFYLHISEEDAKIISVSTDNTVKIWGAEDQSCLFSACSKASGIKGELSACLYAPGTRSLYVAADALALLYLKLRPLPEPRLVVSHMEPVLCCKYNRAFRQVVSCSEGSTVKVWDFETGKQLFEFTSAHGEAAITCLTFDSSGRRLVTGGRDGCLKIWNYNNGHCLHTLKREGKCDEICDCTYAEVNRSNNIDKSEPITLSIVPSTSMKSPVVSKRKSKTRVADCRYIVAVGWDRRINVYFDSTEELHHVQKPQPFWQDDITQGHKEDILCVAHCPPTLLATASYDGEIIVWNMSSGCVCCKLHTPLPTDCTEGGGVDTSVTQVVFLRTRVTTLESGAATLISNGPQGSLNFWSLLSGAPPPANFIPSRVKSPISSIAVTRDDLFLYAADSDGYVYVYSIKDYALGNPEQEPPQYMHHWRAHIKMVVSLEVIDEDRVLLSSSTDCTVRLWSLDGEYIGTFGQTEPWEVFTPASWKHPRVPYEILTDPQSLPFHPVLEGQSSALQVINSDQSPKAQGKPVPKHKESYHSKHPHISITDAEIKMGMNKWLSQISGERLKHKYFKNLNKPLNHKGLSTYHTINCYEIVNVPEICEKPDLSVLGTDFFYESSLEEN